MELLVRKYSAYLINLFLSYFVTNHASPTSRGLSAGSSDVPRPLEPVDKPRDVSIVNGSDQLRFFRNFCFTLKQIMRLIRVKQWAKSTFVFIGLIYSGHFSFARDACCAAIAFTFISSATYIYNDLKDRDADRKHPKKCYRPLAAATISISSALGLMIFLLFLGFGIASQISTSLVNILLGYLILNLFYNHCGKHIILVDVMCIATGFLLRVLAGTLGIGIPLSFWLMSAATLLSLLIALSKRYLEKQLGLQIQTRSVLNKYQQRTLHVALWMTGVMSLLVYVAYVNVVRDNGKFFLMTLPFAAMGIFRFIWLTIHEVQDDDPIHLCMKDSWCYCTLCLFMFFTGLSLVQ